MYALVAALITLVPVAAYSAPQPPEPSERHTATVADFDGDGITDPSLVRPDGNWLILSTACCGGFSWGHLADVSADPVPADYDGDLHTDVATYTPSTARWQVRHSHDQTAIDTVFGGPGDTPVPADYDGDGRAEIVVFAGGKWVLRDDSGHSSSASHGQDGDVPVPADYDGDGRADLAVYRAADRTWWILRSSDGGVNTVSLQESGDLVAPGDYNGDGRADLAVYRPATQTWFVHGVGSIEQFGGAGDVPLTMAAMPVPVPRT